MTVYYVKEKMPLTEYFILGIKRRMKLLNTAQAAEKLGVSVRRVRALIAEGTLQAHQLGREYAIEESALALVTVYRKPGRPPASKLAKKSKKVAK